MTTAKSDDQLLSTGQAAALLGTTSRHVAHLCDRGDLPYTMSGAHRRLRLDDIERLAKLRAQSSGGRLTSDQRQSLWLGHLVAGQLVRDPERVLSDARRTAERFIALGASGSPWLRQWIDLIDEGPDAVLTVLTSTSPQARELRQNSPFSRAVSDAARRRTITAYRRVHAPNSR